MDILNDDCLLLITKKLDFYDQLMLFEATKRDAKAKRWICSLRYNWQHQLSFNLWSMQWKVFDKNEELLRDFLSSISLTVQHLNLWDVTPGRLKTWTHYKFPEMRSLNYAVIFCNTPEKQRLHANDSKPVMDLIVKLFPGLHLLSPDGDFSVIKLRHFRNLHKLYMAQGMCFPNFDALKSTIAHGAFQMLEDLTFYENAMSNKQFRMLECLPNLQTVGIFSVEPLSFRRRIIVRPEDIEQITLNFICMCELDDAEKLINLRQVTLNDMNEYVNSSEELQEFITSLPQLERLDISEAPIFNSEIELWQTVSRCPSLKILNILNSGLNFTSNKRHMDEALNKRSTSLNLHCHKSDEIERQIRLYLKHPKLNVSSEPLKIDQIERRMIKFYYRRH